MWDDGGSWGWGQWLLMSVMMLAVLGLVAWGAIALWGAARGGGEVGRLADATGEPEEILARRLALGEIDAEEYRARLDALHGPRRTPA